ncbi:MAG: hypothetical protein IT204_04290 [Fimbriimonadaceae bacterium]|nr:hypothetical protein [Fimbriimonadaceae bacterium]
MDSLLRFLVRLRQIDRRVIAALTLLCLAVPLKVPLPLKMVPLPATKKLKTTIDELPPGKLVVITCDWEAGTKGECEPLTTTVMDYLMRQNRPFAIVSFAQQGAKLGQQVAFKLAAKHQKEYGRDWINWGYKPNYDKTLLAMMTDLPGTIKEDINGTPVAQLTLMQGVRTLKDVGMLYNVAGSGLLDMYIQFCSGDITLAQACTAVMGPERYPYLQSGQIKGLLVGLGGAAQFEQLTEFKDEFGNPRGKGLQRMGSQSLGHLLVMFLIVIGNLAVWAEKRVGAAPPPVAGEEG